jgi:hypothetical protein
MDSTGVKKGLDQAKGNVSQFAKSMSNVSNAAGAAGVNLGFLGRIQTAFASVAALGGPVAGVIAAVVVAVLAFSAAIGTAIVKTIRWADELTDAAAQTGITVRQLQEIQNAAIGTSASEDDMTAALGRLTDKQGEAIEGNKKTIASFEKLGLSAEQVANANPAELLVLVSRGYVDAGQSASAFSAAADLLGAKKLPKLREALVALGTEGSTMGEKIAKMSNRQVATLNVLADWWIYLRKTVGASIRGMVADFVELEIGWFMKKPVADKLASAEETARMQKEKNQADLAERQKKDARKAAIKDELKAMEEKAKREKALDVNMSFSPVTDSLAKIGGMVGGQVNNAMIALAQRQLAVAERTAEYEKEIAANTRKEKLNAELAIGE